MADGSEGKPHFVKCFGLSARYERCGSTELAEVFTNDEDRTRRAPGEAEASATATLCFDQAIESCLGRCVRARKVCRLNWLTR